MASDICAAVQNGSVDDALHGRRPPGAAGPVRLDWAARTRLGCEAAAALQHLHTAHSMPIVHGRLQPSTILLDEHLRGRLGDAGVAATFGAHQVRQPGRRYIPSCNVMIWEVAARRRAPAHGLLAFSHMSWTQLQLHGVQKLLTHSEVYAHTTSRESKGMASGSIL